ncbi:MAG TPA: MFS transporter [Ktedonobacteraceae bacterium]|nr:MFS transporter [Ktedonobacteraceae bacterium]
MQQLVRIQGKPASIITPTVLMLIGVVGVSFLGLGLVMPLRSLYGRQIGGSSTEIGLMTASYLLAGFLALPMIGLLANRFGTKKILWGGLVLHALLMLAYIPVQNPVLLIGLRALEGIASASVLPTTRALMNTIAPKARQGEALGMLSAAQTTGILVGPAVGTVLASQVGYTPSFLIASVPLALAAGVSMLYLPAQGKQNGNSSEASHSALTGAFTCPLLLAYSLQTVFMITNGVLMAIWSLYMLDHGASLPLIGLSYTTYALPVIALAPLAGRFSDRHGRYWLFLLGLSLTGVIYCMYGLPSLTAWPLVFISLLEGLAAAFARGSLDGFLADVLPAHLKGKVQANFSAAGFLGSLLGATAAGLFYGFLPGLPFLIEGLICLGACFVLLLPGSARWFHSGTREATDDEQ